MNEQRATGHSGLRNRAGTPARQTDRTPGPRAEGNGDPARRAVEIAAIGKLSPHYPPKAARPVPARWRQPRPGRLIRPCWRPQARCRLGARPPGNPLSPRPGRKRTLERTLRDLEPERPWSPRHSHRPRRSTSAVPQRHLRRSRLQLDHPLASSSGGPHPVGLLFLLRHHPFRYVWSAALSQAKSENSR